MLGDILEEIGKQLNGYLDAKISRVDGSEHVSLTNPAPNIGSLFTQGDKLYFSLLNIEEQLSLREGGVNRRVVGNHLLTSQPPVNFNLQVIFIANHSKDYKTELNLIYWVMEFFQCKPLFNLANTPGLANAGFSGDDKLIFELNSLPLKEMHYVWGNLGMKQMPSVVYQIKMLTIQNSTVASEDGVINSIELVNKG